MTEDEMIKEASEILGAPIEKRKIVVMVGPSGIGKSLKLAMAAASLKGYEIEERSVNKSKKINGIDFDLFAMDELRIFGTEIQITNNLKEQEFTNNNYMEDPLEKHKGKGDPNGLRQQFNINGKKFR